MSDHAAAALDEPATTTAGPTGLDYLLAGLMAGAGIIHLAMVPTHAGASALEGVAFAVMAWFQLGVAALILARRVGATLYGATVVGNALILGIWIWSRAVGLPVGAHAGEVEEITAVDGVANALGVGAMAVALVMLFAPRAVRVPVVASAIGAVAVLGLATVAISSPEAADHGHGDDHASGGGHDDHGAALAEMDLVDAVRCDYGFNPQGYWDEAEVLGVDTYMGGAMSSAHHGEGGSLLTGVASPLPDDGRGSLALDGLIVHTEKAGESELGAAGLIVGLSEATDEEYDDWLLWMRNSGQVGGGHEHDAAAPDDDEGHGGHAGPQPWQAMVDQEQCDALAQELEIARDVALAHPTAADATAAGWQMVTPYVPGIAAHYMNFSLVDDTFAVDEPEMILYDGNGPDANVVGLSYYVVHKAEAEPTQGFTGANDHYHRHVGLCIKDGITIGDSSTTQEECEARGGKKGNSNSGWMSHAWVVPGCESPWGVFSGASPLLDNDLQAVSGTDDGGCAGSGVRDRYDLSPGRAPLLDEDGGVVDGGSESASGD